MVPALVCFAVWAEKSCLGLGWELGDPGSGGGEGRLSFSEVDVERLGRTRTHMTCPSPRATDRHHSDSS